MNAKNIDDPAEQSRAREASQGRGEHAAGSRGLPGGTAAEGTVTARFGTCLVGRPAEGSGGLPAAAVSDLRRRSGRALDLRHPAPGGQRADRLPARPRRRSSTRPRRLLHVTGSAFGDSPQAAAIMSASARSSPPTGSPCARCRWRPTRAPTGPCAGAARTSSSARWPRARRRPVRAAPRDPRRPAATRGRPRRRRGAARPAHRRRGGSARRRRRGRGERLRHAAAAVGVGHPPRGARPLPDRAPADLRHRRRPRGRAAPAGPGQPAPRPTRSAASSPWSSARTTPSTPSSCTHPSARCRCPRAARTATTRPVRDGRLRGAQVPPARGPADLRREHARTRTACPGSSSPTTSPSASTPRSSRRRSTRPAPPACSGSSSRTCPGSCRRARRCTTWARSGWGRRTTAPACATRTRGSGASRAWCSPATGSIPTANACNPTLTSVALAVRGAQALAADLAENR